MVGIIGGVTWLVGLVLIGLGAILSITDWKRKRAAAAGKPGEFVPEPAGAADVLEGLAKLFDALKGYGTGQFLMALGLTLVIIGAIISTAGAITA